MAWAAAAAGEKEGEEKDREKKEARDESARPPMHESSLSSLLTLEREKNDDP